MARMLILDNYDSFTYNLVHLLRQLGCNELDVFRNDKISLDEVQHYDSIVLSPGPGIPQEAGIMPALVRKFAPQKKILGVCLGHQCIGESFGASLHNLTNPMHGKASPIVLKEPVDPLFRGLPNTFTTGRYHSWVVSKDRFPEELRITAVDSAGEIMALAHQRYEVRGVQFHPESILTEFGAEMMKNWISL